MAWRHPFFIHHQTPEGRSLYASSPTPVPVFLDQSTCYGNSVQLSTMLASGIGKREKLTPKHFKVQCAATILKDMVTVPKFCFAVHLQMPSKNNLIYLNNDKCTTYHIKIKVDTSFH